MKKDSGMTVEGLQVKQLPDQYLTSFAKVAMVLRLVLKFLQTKLLQGFKESLSKL